MKKMIVLLILIVAALLSGCLEEEQTYYNEDNPDNTFTLKSDGTYQLISKGNIWVGDYEESEETLILHNDPPLPSFILYKEGENWTYPRDNELFILKKD